MVTLPRRGGLSGQRIRDYRPSWRAQADPCRINQNPDPPFRPNPFCVRLSFPNPRKPPQNSRGEEPSRNHSRVVILSRPRARSVKGISREPEIFPFPRRAPKVKPEGRLKGTWVRRPEPCGIIQSYHSPRYAQCTETGPTSGRFCGHRRAQIGSRGPKSV